MLSNPTGWLRAEDVDLDVRLANKVMTLQALARRLAARHGGQADPVFDALRLREALGSTGLGHGVALPHARMPGLAAPIAAFMRLERAIAFDAPDDKPVALVLALLLPLEAAQQNLQLMAHCAGLLSEPAFRDRLARASDAQQVARMFEPWPPA